MSTSVQYKSIRSKFSLVIISACFAVILLVSFLFGVIEFNSFRQKSAEELQTLAAVLGSHLTQPLLLRSDAEATNILSALETNFPIHAAYLFDLHYAPFSQYLDLDFSAFVQRNVRYDIPGRFPELWRHAEGPIFRYGLNSLSLYVPILYQGTKIGGLYLLTDLSGMHQRLLGLVLVVLIAGGIAIIFAWWLAGRMQKPISEPILQLAETVRQISTTGEYHLRSQKYSNDEVGQLVDGFNEMLSQIEIRDRKISNHQSYLEQTVIDRTAALTETVRDLELARQQAETANQSKSIFLANMTHELRTPLVGVLGMNELLMDSKLDTGQHTLAESVQRSGQELLELINDILDFSKIEAGHLKLERVEVDLLQLVEEVVAILADRAYSKGIEFLFRVEPRAARTVESDPQRLRQILFNLLGNAVKFTQQGAVSLSLTRDAEGQFVFAVEDTGIGMDKEAQSIVFNAFSQVDDSTSRLYGGTGLGLSIVRDLTHMMNGQLSLQSESGKGSIFTVKLPLKDLVSSAIPFPLAPSDKTMILLDSNPGSRESLLYRLQDLGYNAEGVDSMSAFIHKCQTTKVRDCFDFALLTEGSFSESAEFVKLVKQYCQTTICLRKKFSTTLEKNWDIDLLQPLLWSQLSRDEIFGKGKQQPVKPIPPEESPFLGSILIVDDNASTRELIGFSLVGSGWKNDEARTAAEAFDLVGNQEYQLILMDINMPGMDGFAATRQLRQQGLDTPIFALTAHGDAGTMENCLAVGMQGVLRKPFRQGELFRILNQYDLRMTAQPDSVQEGA